MSFREILDRETLRRLLDYEPETGNLLWRPRPPEMFSSPSQHRRWNTRFAGKPALSWADEHGYKLGCILHRSQRAHRAIWKWMTGEDPDIIDHINGDRGDNRWANLRSTDSAGNAWNTAMPRNNTSGCMGVHWARRQKRWRAHITCRGEHIHLGFHKSFEDAVAVRKRAEAEIGYHPNHGRAR